jgi:hypothetical protein
MPPKRKAAAGAVARARDHLSLLRCCNIGSGSSLRITSVSRHREQPCAQLMNCRLMQSICCLLLWIVFQSKVIVLFLYSTGIGEHRPSSIVRCTVCADKCTASQNLSWPGNQLQLRLFDLLLLRLLDLLFDLLLDLLFDFSFDLDLHTGGARIRFDLKPVRPTPSNASIDNTPKAPKICNTETATRHMPTR